MYFLVELACNIPKVGQPWITNLRIMWTAKWGKTRHAFSCSTLGQGAISTNLFLVIAQMEPSYTYSCWHKNDWGLQGRIVFILSVNELLQSSGRYPQ